MNTTYTYDSQHRPATITKADGSLSVYSYNEGTKTTQLNQYPDPADRTTGTAWVFPSNFGDFSPFIVRLYPITNSVISSPVAIRNETYELDASNHVTLVLRGPGNTSNSQSGINDGYTYTGENITRGSTVNGRSILSTSTYEYDANINPFFGLTDPAIVNTQRFSRNNVVKETKVMSGSTDLIRYEYVYNQQGLPTKRTTSVNDVVTETLTFGYESY